ncbi:hypothetical protein CDV50_10290 [Haematobacter massiliensis]|uniref:hypothetical protein n=1 Tax=Haematobacter massiliensis TaxID=195105 RepID=UPI000B49990F|nr:hypothetical protein [Haematobacter massiliensis]OWJ71386.1 hypothetical protein CDV50_10290 [Haematobacter massiliensis]
MKNEAAANRPRKSLGGMTPLEYMLGVMNDGDADDARRDRMAMAAAPFVHARASDVAPGKKEQRKETAQQASSAGKFCVPSAPKLIVNNGA